MNSSKKKTKLYTIIFILALAGMLFRGINYFGFEQTSILFVGIPALIAILIVKYTNTPKTLYGVTFRVITLFLLICSFFLGEGTVCILFMAPLFYGIAALAVFIYKLLQPNKKINSLVLFSTLFLVSQPYEINKVGEIHSIQSSITVNNNIMLNELTNSKDLNRNLPLFFDKLQFPKPISVKANGIGIGDIQKIHFLSKTKGVGILSLEVVQSSNNKIIYKVAEDSTHIDHWLTWKKVQIEINKIDVEKSEITWTTDFICDLGPSWYFEPFEKYAVGLMNEHLLNSYFNTNDYNNHQHH